ncbi:MAG TPA: carboxypeptidase regulatory-like domain-containing protein [Bryobacteraceae bacterium]|nr:carboxypeptidase regulatory-like domain-containing protein [Bryobacteraceae bacterium]
MSIAADTFSQIDRSSLTGTVRDPSGASIGSVQVRAVQHATGLNRETTTGADGVYAIPDLPVGKYTVLFSGSGFAVLRVESVDQTIGLTRTLNVTLTVATQGEEITVSENIAQLNQTTASLGGRTEQKQVMELPMNGRNWYSLAALVPGAIDSGGSNMKSVRFAGRGLDDNNFTLDGVDATGIINQAQRGQGRMTIPTESIAEFRAESALYSTELGGAPGGQISVTSPSGTNSFHGSLYEYFRNDVFDARSPFDSSSAAPFRLNQFGSSVGGPIEQNRTFFFATYEGYQQHLGQSITGFVPTNSFRSSVVPSLGPLISAYPHANGPVLSATTATYVFAGLQKVDEDTGLFRVDHRFKETLTAFIRYNQDEALSNVPTGNLGITQTVDTQPKNGVAELLQVISPSLTNEYKFGFNEAITHTKTLSPLADTISTPGFSPITGGSTKDERGATLSWIDNLTWVRGRQTVKTGVEVRYVEMDQGNSFTGTLTWSTLANFAANQLDKAAQTAELPMKHQRKTQVFSYVQDEYKVTADLTLNLGLRYEFYNVLHETQNRAIPFDFNTCGPGGYCPRASDFTFPNTLDFDPRAALAWSPARLHGNTGFRIGGGIYHGDGQLDDQNLPIANDVQRYSLTRVNFPNLSYPIDPFLAQAAGVVTPRLLDRRRKDEYVSEWGASIQQKLSHSVVGTVSYVGSKGTDLLTTSYVNGINPATGTRPYPAFGIVEYRGNNNNSTFNGLQVSTQRYFQNGLLFSANYLWSHSINDGTTGGGEAVFPQILGCRACERASSDQDIRQVFSANTVYELPLGRGKRYLANAGLARLLLGGWQLSAIVTARTGLPVNVTVDRASGDLPDGYNTDQRPDLVPGVSLTPPGGATPTQWINPAAFSVPAPGQWGNAGRNLARAEGTWQVDGSLDRRISLTERMNLQLRAEAFNLLNRAQYGAPLADISAPSTFGRITTLVNNGPTGSGTPRQFQFALRLGF